MNYTVDVAQSGKYTLSLRYASGNTAGGGPIYLELDGQVVSGDLQVSYSGDLSAFATAILQNVELREGTHVLRLNFDGGELNIGRLTFTYVEPLDYTPPIADAGDDSTLVAPATSITRHACRR